MRTRENKNCKLPCEKYRLDMADYATGDRSFLSPDKEKEVIQHLKECKACREAFLDYEDIYATSVTESHFAKPETQKKYAELLERIKGSGAGKTIKVLIDIKQDIKQTARTVYDLLKTNGEMSIPVLVEKTRLKEYYIQQAIGWLGGNEKITLAKDDKTAYVRLLPENPAEGEARP